MKVRALMEKLELLEPEAEIRISILKNGTRPFGGTKEIDMISPVFDQDTGRLWYTISVPVTEFIKRKNGQFGS